MAKFFGKTWWGEEWLKALTGIDLANRIPRGAAYARSGKVKKLEIKNNTVSAIVQGTWNYFVNIEIPEFDDNRFEDFINRLREKPAVISKLLNRELDPEILDIAKKSGLKVFPHTWRDITMHCDCPDSAHLCKHIAAVIYTISREIDNNPFMVFKIHGVDLIEELKNRGLALDTENLIEVPDTDALIIKDKDPKEPEDFSRTDFSVISDNFSAIGNILPKETPFYQEASFYKKYNAQTALLAKTAKNILERKSDFWENIYKENPDKKLTHDTDFHFFVESDFSFSVKDVSRDVEWNFKELLPQVFNIPHDYITDYSQSVIAINQLLICSLYLLASGNFAPAVFKTPSKTYQTMWFGTKIDSAVEDVLKNLEKLIPQDFFSVKPSNGRKYYPVKNRAGLTVALINTFFVSLISKPDSGDKIMQFLFKQKSERFSGPGEKEIPGSIKAWTDRLFFNTGEYGFQIIVNEENEGYFSLEIAVILKKETVMLTNVLRLPKYENEKFKILKELTLISSFLDGYEEYINFGAAVPMVYDLESLSEFLFNIAPSLRLLGVKIMLPKSLQKIVRPKVSMKISGKSGNSKSYIRLDELLDFDWQVALGDNMISYDEFLKLYSKASGLVKFKQNYFYVNESDIERIKKIIDNKTKLTKAQILQTALSEEFDNSPVKLDKAAKDLIERLKKLEEIPVPENVHAVLRPYQQRGYEWLFKNYTLGFGSILADDMGLGKTLQTIAFLQKLKNEGALKKKKALVVVPTGLISNWQNEAVKFAPELSVFTYHGIDRDIKKYSSDVLLTTYGVMRSDVDKLKKQKWAVMVIDEAQNIKNQTTAQTKAAFSLTADTKIALSGTPVENRLSEFWSIMNFVNTGYFGSLKKFSESFANPIQELGDKVCAERLKKSAAPFMMRRLKTDKTIINDLPDKIEQNEFAQLTASQAAVYEKTLSEAMSVIKGIEQTDSQSLFKRQGLILQMILALKQICNHPALFLKNGDFNPELSGKSEMLLSLVDNIMEGGQKALVFTQFREMGDMLSEMIFQKTGKHPLFLHGGCTVEQRKSMVDKFQTQKQHQIFILSLKAAGTGLNLTAASHVIHYDLWWNPAVEAQATDRAYRIGQHQNVVVHRFITQNTFEEKIDKMIQDKKQLADLTVATGESWLGKLTNKELDELF
jgi:uncharacterized Zn finger protein/superfamily II DNA or RNA helicase